MGIGLRRKAPDSGKVPSLFSFYRRPSNSFFQTKQEYNKAKDANTDQSISTKSNDHSVESTS